ncbi:hypothetical protein [Nostoc sp.]|uniref:hypothetical protein n=1 Tax=Nostoc sp. TaxID=1180 RepID=UPI002FF6AD3C
MKKFNYFPLFILFSVLLITGNLFFSLKAFSNTKITNLKQDKPICYMQNNQGELVDLTNICGKTSIINSYHQSPDSNLNTSNQSPDSNFNNYNPPADSNINFNSDSFPEELLPSVKANEQS